MHIINQTGYIRKCNYCLAMFYICSCCYRGNRYCPGQVCAKKTAKIKHKNRQERYLGTDRGKLAKKLCQNRYLEKKERLDPMTLDIVSPSPHPITNPPIDQTHFNQNEEKKIDATSTDDRDSVEEFTGFSDSTKTEIDSKKLNGRKVANEIEVGGIICSKCRKKIWLIIQKGDDG
jgi:hypothetical protein